MSLNVSDLNYDSKRQILGYIQNQIGISEYQRILNSIGEDALIGLVIQQLEKNNQTFDKQDKVIISERKIHIIKNVFFGISIAFLITAVIFGVILKENWFGKVLIGIGGMPISVWVFKYIDFSEIFVASMLISCMIITVIAFFCGFYQLITGMEHWWPSFFDTIFDTLWPIIAGVLFIIVILVWIFKGIINNMPRF